MKKIIVDMFGADAGPEMVVRGAAKALAAQTEYDIVFAGSTLIAQIVLQEEAAKRNQSPAQIMPRVSVIETNSFVTNRENPKNMVKDRNDTSMVLALRALKDNDEIRAMVSCGSTGCALVASCFHLGLEKGLLQPALASALPKENGGFAVLLDCGSNLAPKCKDYADYARLGAALCRNAYGVSKPVAGLLNVGAEKGKGTPLLTEACERLETEAEEAGYAFCGFLEGGDLLSGKADVIVTDGFTGNVLLKGLEHAGEIAARLAQTEKETVKANAFDPSLRQIEDPYNEDLSPEGALADEKIRRFFGYNAQAGAIFLGTKKIVLKAHGAATEDTVCSCILQAINLDKGKA